MTQQEVMDYRVELDAFSGPLDLLLYLVRRQEVDILNLPIAEITGRFLEFLEVLQVLDLDLVGDFVVMASSLVEIKSRMALPGPEEPAELVEADEDPRADLVRQLLEYKRFKDATRLLEDQAAKWQQRYPRLSDDRPRGGNDPSRDLIKEVELWDLVSALSRVLRKNTESAPAKVLYDETPIAVYMDRIKERVLLERCVPFSAFFAGTNSRSQIIGIFLALLELLRHYKFRAEQPQDYHEIWILPPLPGAVEAPAAPPPADVPIIVPLDDVLPGIETTSEAPANDAMADETATEQAAATVVEVISGGDELIGANPDEAQPVEGVVDETKAEESIPPAVGTNKFEPETREETEG